MPTKIEWTDETWNPITGCTPISPGCRNCYAKRMANRLRGRFGYPADEPFRPTFHWNKLNQPTRWRKARTIFVCSMGDLWHPAVHQDDRNFVFAEVQRAPQHRYLFLTKRPELVNDFPELPNCALGVTAEDQQRANERIPILLKIPAAIRFVSLEPLLGEVDLRHYLGGSLAGRGLSVEEMADLWGKVGLGWIIAGGETGPGARPMRPQWARLLRDQCTAAGVPFLLKSRGEYLTLPEVAAGSLSIVDALNANTMGGGFVCIGKKAAGRLLDGREWNEFPEWGEPQAAAQAAREKKR